MSDLITLPALGSNLAGYTLIRLLGEGGMGTVFEAERDGERFALKVLHAQLTDGPAVVRFAREVKVASGLRNPHVVPVLDAEIDPSAEHRFLVMPLIRGRDLERWLSELGPLDPVIAARIIVQAAKGLASAHEAGIVHRDIKPSNLMLADEGDHIVVKVCDFGVAKEWNDNMALTASSSVVGTPIYMAPEQLLSSKSVDSQADVWSLGMCLYEALSGKPALGHIKSMSELLMTVTKGEIPSLQDSAPWVDPELATIVHGALIREKGQRCPDVASLITALLPFCEGDTQLTVAMVVGCTNERMSKKAAWAPRPSSWSDSVVPLISKARSSVDDALLGKTIGERYKPVRKLGQGGMGAVYEADSVDGERVALKVILNASGPGSAEIRRRFVRESRAAMAVKSEHVVRVFAADTDAKQEVPYLVMELLKGIDLETLIKQVGALEPRSVARVIQEACEGIAAAHDQGVIHRDVKPANLFLHELDSGEIVTKVCDFGIAKDVSVAEGQTTTIELTRTGGMLGSPYYMSPEQAKNAKNVDARTDVWSLSVTLFEALSGTRLWQSSTSMGELILAICTGEIPHLQDVAPWVDPKLAEVVYKGLERDPGRRWSSLRTMAAALAPLASSTRVTRRELCSLRQSERMSVKARFTPTTDPLIASASFGRPATTAVEQQPKSIAPWAVAASLAIAVLGVGGYALRGASQDTLGGGTPGATLPAIGTAPTPARSKVQVRIKGDGAQVTVNGEPRGLERDNMLSLEGEAGQVFDVGVQIDSATKVTRVMLSREGKAEPDVAEGPPSSATTTVTASSASTGSTGSNTSTKPSGHTGGLSTSKPEGPSKPTAATPTAPTATVVGQPKLSGDLDLHNCHQRA